MYTPAILLLVFANMMDGTELGNQVSSALDMFSSAIPDPVSTILSIVELFKSTNFAERFSNLPSFTNSVTTAECRLNSHLPRSIQGRLAKKVFRLNMLTKRQIIT